MNATITAYFLCFASQAPVTTPILERKNATMGVWNTNPIQRSNVSMRFV